MANSSYQLDVVTTSYFSSSFLSTCSHWSHWPGLEIGLERMCFITLYNPSNTSCLWPILAGNKFLNIKYCSINLIHYFNNLKFWHRKLPQLLGLLLFSPPLGSLFQPKQIFQHHSPADNTYYFPVGILIVRRPQLLLHHHQC